MSDLSAIVASLDNERETFVRDSSSVIRNKIRFSKTKAVFIPSSESCIIVASEQFDHLMSCR